MRKGKKNVSEEPTQVEQGPTPYEIGLHGSVEALYQADKAAKADMAAKEAVFEESRRKYRKAVFFQNHKEDHKNADRATYHAALDVFYQIHQELQNGAAAAFMDNRPENVQEILSNPEPFLVAHQFAYDLVSSALINLAGEVPDPETLLLALAKMEEDERQNILDNTLYTLVSEHNHIEGAVSVLLKAGAKADYDSSRTLAAAFINQPDAIADMLRENGADFDDAIATMLAHPKQYGGTDSIRLLQYKEKTDTTIQQLQKTIEDLTGKPAKPDAPAETAAPRRLKISPPTPQ